MKSLYTKDHRYTDEAAELQDRVSTALAAIFTQYVKMGYSPREISHVIQAVVTDLELSTVLDSRK